MVCVCVCFFVFANCVFFPSDSIKAFLSEIKMEKKERMEHTTMISAFINVYNTLYFSILAYCLWSAELIATYIQAVCCIYTHTVQNDIKE